MAIAPDILLAILIDENDPEHTITLQNTNPRFPKREIKLDLKNPSAPVKIDSKTLGILTMYVHSTNLHRME
jgi:hypothetical protein